MPGLEVLDKFMVKTFALVKELPVALRPKYFCIVIEKIYAAAVRKVMTPTQDPFLSQL
jgi:hypothetical protein